jgi:hypothetical protein
MIHRSTSRGIGSFAPYPNPEVAITIDDKAEAGEKQPEIESSSQPRPRFASASTLGQGGGPVDHQMDRLERILGDHVEQKALPVARNVVISIRPRQPGYLK